MSGQLQLVSESPDSGPDNVIDRCSSDLIRPTNKDMTFPKNNSRIFTVSPFHISWSSLCAIVFL